MTNLAAPSQQMANLMARWGVTTQRALNRAVRDEAQRETNERMSVAVAEVMIDRMLEAEYQRIESGAYERAEREDQMTTQTTNPIDDLPDEPVDPRNDPRLDDVAFITTDEGQALLAAAQKATADERAATRKAEMKEKALAAAKAKADIHQGSGPVEIVRPATNGKASRAAAKAKAIESFPKPGATRKADAAKRATAAPKAIVNHPLKLGDPIVDGDITYRPILNRAGDVSAHPKDDYPWRCPTCSRRLRSATCVGVETTHKPEKAPDGYRFESRVVKA